MSGVTRLTSGLSDNVDPSRVPVRVVWATRRQALDGMGIANESDQVA